LRVLVACERSGVVRRAFRAAGHEAWSCDIEPSDDDSIYHLKEDVLGVLQRAALCGGVDQWDLMIAHPPCTYLCNSGVCWLWELQGNMYGIRGRIKNKDRWNKMIAASNFFRALLRADIPHICIENPIPHRYTVLRKYDQIIQPYMFGHPESKATCLWLKNLPKLVETDNVKAQWRALPKAKAQRLHWLGPSKDRARLRSQTYEGIAKAMAEQWSEHIEGNQTNTK